MTGQVVRKLVVKDLYLLRWMSAGAIVAGLISAALMGLGALPINGGGVLLICTLIVLNIFLVTHGVVQERKEKVALFILSLPVAPMQYVTAKVTANAIAFIVPWAIVSATVIAVVAISPIPNGYVPLWAAVLGYLLFYYCALLGVGLNTESTAWQAVAITVGNVSVNFFIMLLFSLPSVRAHGEGPTAVWSGGIATIVAAEIIGGVVVLALAIYARSRRAEFV